MWEATRNPRRQGPRHWAAASLDFDGRQTLLDVDLCFQGSDSLDARVELLTVALGGNEHLTH